MTIVLIALVALLVALIAFVVLTYNRLVGARLACETSWSQIDVALKLRHDLVPRLAETVAGYADHERATLEEVARARGEAVAADGSPPGPRGTAEAALGGRISNAVLLAEDYPELLASESFSRLQRELSDVEERIAITRRVYNDTVETYNTAVAIFPALLVARAFGFLPHEFFDAPVEAEAVPSVSIGART
jgi:LemA protein